MSTPSEIINRENQIEENLKTNISVIGSNNFLLCCVSVALGKIDDSLNVRKYLTIDEWEESESSETDQIVLLCSRELPQDQSELLESIDRVASISEHARVIVVSDYDAPTVVVAALKKGARGYILGNSSLDVALRAIHLVRAGGTFVPAASFLAHSKEEEPQDKPSQFTDKQMAVIQRLRRGESNKIIAHGLEMAECTVKVHIRNIMQRTKARNRTEIAYLTNHIFQSGEVASPGNETVSRL